MELLKYFPYRRVLLTYVFVLRNIFLFLLLTCQSPRFSSFPCARPGYHNDYASGSEISRAMLRDFSVRGPGHTPFVAFGKFSIKLWVEDCRFNSCFITKSVLLWNSLDSNKFESYHVKNFWGAVA